MVTVREHYEVFPYPARDPAEERHRLITGSPSHPLEMDHILWGGQRDWNRPLRILVAGGGTGDGLIQLAQTLTDAGRAYDITYLDLSTASRAVAEARAQMRGLGNITFHTASLLEAAEYGRFDYIDCCGVLHHLPDPPAGFRALRAALAPGGGLGFMVYAPYGRSGVYPLQEAFAALFQGLPPGERLIRARQIVADLPEGHPFRANRNLSDHLTSEAGFYDLLLHAQDRAYDVPQLLEVLAETGWQLAGFATPALYDLSRLTEVPEGMDPVTRMTLAEKLRGTIRVHTGYAVAQGSPAAKASPATRALVPHLRGAPAARLAQLVAQGHAIPVTLGGRPEPVTLPRAAAPLLAAIDGRRSLGQIAQASGRDPIAFGTLWASVHAALEPCGLLVYSALLTAAAVS